MCPDTCLVKAEVFQGQIIGERLHDRNLVRKVLFYFGTIS